MKDKFDRSRVFSSFYKTPKPSRFDAVAGNAPDFINLRLIGEENLSRKEPADCFQYPYASYSIKDVESIIADLKYLVKMQKTKSAKLNRKGR